MMELQHAPIPDPRPDLFRRGIRHPDLWLWDSWIQHVGQRLDLFCLALSKTDDHGNDIHPEARNRYRFHVRRFSSSDQATTWKDRGAVATPGMMGDGSDSGNVWSGSALVLPDGRSVSAFTGIRAENAQRPFIQSVNVRAPASPDAPAGVAESAVMCAQRDHQKILDKGYYLGPLDELGSRDGEGGGPILCWRDPFLFVDQSGEILLFLAAKVAPSVPAIARIRLRQRDGDWCARELLPPIVLPDGDAFTQAELPKIYFDSDSERYTLLISSTNRQREDQPDSEIIKEHRIYIADSLDGPWVPFRKQGSSVSGLDGLFGGSLLEAPSTPGVRQLLSPYSELAPSSVRLTFGAVAPVQI